MKPKVDYRQFQQQLEGTLAVLIETVIRDRNQPGARALGASQMYTLRRAQRDELGQKKCAELRAVDLLSYCKRRRASGVLPQTINTDITYISGALKYGVEILEFPGAKVGYSAYQKAKPQLVREQLVAKSQARDRRPTDEELHLLLEHFAKPPKKMVKGFIPMVPVVKFAYLSARRISETCRITWGDLNYEKRTCIVRDLKNARGKGFHGEFPLLGEAWAVVMGQPRLDPSNPNERIFKHNSKSVSAKFTLAKKAIGISGVRLHDLRRHALSGLFEQGYSVPEVQMVSLHKNPTILLKTYVALKPEDLHRGPAARRLELLHQ